MSALPLSGPLGAGQAGSGEGSRPPERVERPTDPPIDRTSDAPEAPEVLESCGRDLPNGLELPDLALPYSREHVRFSLQVKDEVVPYRIMSMTALPRESIEIEVVLGEKAGRYNACADGGELQRLDADEWTWWAPEKPGVYSVYVTESASDVTLLLQMLVMEPYAGEDVFHGFRLGQYETVPLRQNPKYERPAGLIRVEPGMEDLWLTPHFQLGQFLCKQEGGYPKFAIVHERLLLKLELLLEKVNDAGIEASSFAVLSGFRTPHYNRAIGNSTRYSRHLYGDAADIYIDRDGDGRMDDLTGDGKVTRADAEKMAAVVEEANGSLWYKPFIGGLGIYGPKPHRGPFIHVDTRGFTARW